ncbi:unnamed protein product [Kuraishia capsulata CBS 1993]|uniref:RING-type E3 ubiquitin transferase n=1 Tax=Kuraishia capsulata CBS 1993 TaxID=1382522 RepID=W6MFV9_9ASCO|nr:uncharacterized protein KUCA_T00000258001 [Kuraishia capsulata CBS 1993]CDK24298.1 unnamed protein product [Kuraishia capsulata CBS 1993]
MVEINKTRLLFFIIFMTLMIPGPAPPDGLSGNGAKVQALQQLKDDISTSRGVLFNSTYEQPTGNLTGLKLSYQDALEHRNISLYPFEDRQGPYEENQRYSILPNYVRKLAIDSLNSEEETIQALEFEDEILEHPKWNAISEVFGSDVNIRAESHGAFWKNITGSLIGDFQRVNHTFEHIPMPLPPYMKALLRSYNTNRTEGDDNWREPNDASSFERDVPNFHVDELKTGNVTELSGNLKVNIQNTGDSSVEGSNGSVRVRLQIKMTDIDEVNIHSLALSGVYHPDSGNLIATTRSAKYAGSYGIPHLNFDETHYNRSKAAMSDWINQTSVDEVDVTMIDTLLDASLGCEMIAFLHFNSTNLSADEMRMIDDELWNPLGRPHKSIPPIAISSGVLYSPDCGLLIKATGLVGEREEVQNKRIQRVVLLGIILLFAQIIFSIKQMSATNTPSTLSRISFWTIAMMNLIDGSLSMLYLLSSIVFQKLYLQLAVSSFLGFTLASVFEMRYMILIYTSQMNERDISWGVALRGTAIDDRNNERIDERENPNNNVGTEEPLLPLNQARPQAVQQTQQQPRIIQDEQTVSGQIYLRLFFFLIVFSFLVLNASLWPRKDRMVFEYVVLLVLNSFWVPQIYRNTLRGSRRSFGWDFVIGTSVLRVIPIAYLCLVKNNPFSHHQDQLLISLIVIWLGIQIFVLVLQELFGARFFLPDRLLPKSYDYHPVLTAGDLEHGFGVEHDDEGVHHEDGKCKVDCAICMNEVEIPIAKSSEHLTNIMNRRGYMVTPCRHIFHTNCLESWMKYKLQCPVCRNSLPPI